MSIYIFSCHDSSLHLLPELSLIHSFSINPSLPISQIYPLGHSFSVWIFTYVHQFTKTCKSKILWNMESICSLLVFFQHATTYNIRGDLILNSNTRHEHCVDIFTSLEIIITKTLKKNKISNLHKYFIFISDWCVHFSATKIFYTKCL